MARQWVPPHSLLLSELLEHRGKQLGPHKTDIALSQPQAAGTCNAAPEP